MKRREMLLTTGAAVVGLSAFPFGWTHAAEKKKQKVLYFTRSAGFEHQPVARTGDELASSEKMLIEWGKAAGFDVECSKDGAIFDGDLDQYDCLVFYTTGDLTKEKTTKPQAGKPMSPQGKVKLLEAIKAGKGFVGIHAATDTFNHTGRIDPYTAMIGGEFLTHGKQQVATMKVADPKFPGMEGIPAEFAKHDEWYTQCNIANDLHVILVQETKGMEGPMYHRPNFPATWARMHDKGRVYYTSMGHGKIWTDPTFRQVVLGGIAWAMGNVTADVTPNIAHITPGANEAPKIVK